MVPSNSLLTKMVLAFKIYIGGQLTSPGWIIKRVSNPFTPGPNLVAADVTVDTAWLQDAIAIVGATVRGTNPANQNVTIANSEGQTSDVSTAATARTVYGVILQEQTGFTPVAAWLYPVPLNINAVNQQTLTPNLAFEFPPSMVR